LRVAFGAGVISQWSGGGLPVHIAAKVLGHANLATTQHYLAVFPDEMIRAYRTYIDKRRSIRPEAEYREPTNDEWAEFRQHFHERKLEAWHLRQALRNTVQT
jgi:hypothetical protein